VRIKELQITQDIHIQEPPLSASLPGAAQDRLS
jgi:hypothetical protein